MHAASPTRAPWHSLVWLVWAVAAATAVQIAPSPVYVVLVIAICALTVEALAPDGPLHRAFPALVALGTAFGLLRVLIAILTTHTGLDVLFTLPHATLPRALGGFTVGGTVETTALLQSANQGLAIVGIMAAFGAFNALASHYELVQSAPRAFHELGLIVTVALAFVPATIESVVAVRDADRARTGGRAIRRGRYRRLMVPVLERGMERAVALSESMDSRGFATGTHTGAEQLSAWCGLAGLVTMGASFAALVGRRNALALVLAAAGAGLLVGAVASASRAATRTRHRRRRLDQADVATMLAAASAPLLLALLSAAGDASLTWSASPPRWPDVHLLPVIALLPLLTPLFAASRSNASPSEPRARPHPHPAT